MDSEVDIHTHTFPSWEEYPRIHYFKRRFTDVLTRYNRLLGALPKSFVDTKVANRLDQIKDEFEKGAVVHVIGKDIDSSDLSFYGKGNKKTNVRDAGVIAYVYHMSIKVLELKKTQDIVVQFLTEASQKCDLKPRDGDIIFLVCNVDSSCSKSKEDEYLLELHQALQENLTELKVQRKNILLGLEHTNLKKKISDEIELKIILGFSEIISDLQRFDLVEETSSVINILETVDIKDAVYGFLRSPGIFKEITDFNDTEKAKEDFVELVVAKLCRTIKCAASGPLAKKYCLKLAVCNDLLHEVNFEKALAESVTKNTRYDLLKILDTKRETGTCYKNDYMLYKMQQDLTPVFEKMEDKFVCMRRFSAIVRRMLFEIEGYFKQSIVSTQKEPEPAKMSAELRQDILSIQGVYGIGTIYGRLEIHIEEQNQSTATVNVGMQDTSSERENKKLEEGKCESDQQFKQKAQNVESKADLDSLKKPKFFCDDTQSDYKTGTDKGKMDLEKVIASVMKKHNFHYPYTVRYVLKKPVDMNGCFEPGDTLVGHPNKYGTLGALLKTKDGDLYGVTCAHVVAGCRRVFLEKEGKNPFSICQKVVMNDDQCRLIDLAALMLLPSLQDSCKTYLEENGKRVKKVDIAMASPDNLLGRFVHKFGAKTGLTCGVIISVDYSIFGPQTEDYVVIVDPLAAENPSDLPKVAWAFTSLNTLPAERNEQPSGEFNETVSQETNTSNGSRSKDVLKEVSKTSKLEESKSVPSDSSVKLEAFAKTEHLVYVRESSRSTNDRKTALEDKNDAILFVRNICEAEIDNYTKRSIFAEKGDSGAVICAQDLSDTGSNCVAVSMLSAGDFKIEGLDCNKALSFMLKDGFRKLSEQYQLNFI